MARWISAAVVFLLALVGIGWFLMTRPTYEPKDLITLGAAAFAGLACLQAWRSANAATQNAKLAQRTEELGRYGWAITLHPNGDHYVLRNTGTLAAHDVKFSNVEDFAHMEFFRHHSDEGPLILPGQAKAFYAIEGWGGDGKEVLIDWRPDGEHERQTFNEALAPMPSHVGEAERRARSERAAERAEERATTERVVAETRRLLIDLADAWGAYQANSSAHNRMRVQGLVAALPGNFAKEIGYAVDVQRGLWEPGQWPLEVFVQPEDQELVRENAPMIELMWNLIQVQLPEIVDGDNSQSPMGWYRIEHAVSGYVELVGRRESGNRELVNGPRDRKRRAEALADLAELPQRFAKEPLPEPKTTRGEDDET